MAREIRHDNVYKDRLLKLIPSEIVAAYLVIEGLIPKDDPQAALVSLISSVILLVFIPFYLKRTMAVQKPVQILFTMVSFVVWVYSLGGPFAHYDLYTGYIGSVILVLWTLLIPFFYRPSAEEG